MIAGLPLLVLVANLAAESAVTPPDQAKQAPPEQTPAAAAPPAPAKPGGDSQPAAGGDDLSSELDQVLKSPAPPSQTRKSSSPGGSGLLNPDISVIADGVAGAVRRTPLSLSGDDPDLTQHTAGKALGFTLQELEVGFQSTVDPYFTANVFLTIPNLSGIEVEEAYAATTALPWGFQLRAGVFRAAAGRQNEQHLHMQDFTLRPLLNAEYLGPDGLRPPGVELSWLAPTPFFLRVAVEAMSAARDRENPTFGGALRTSPAALASVKTFFPLAEALSLMLGGTVATGHAPVPNSADFDPIGVMGPRTLLYGGDLYLKYKRPNETEGYFGLALQAEYFFRRTFASQDATTFEPTPSESDGGAYVQLVSQLARRWHAGVRYDVLGLPQSDFVHRAQRASVMGMFTPSEFARIRLQVFEDFVGGGVEPNPGALLLLEYSIGAHGAHPF